jgi:hypothetical protein
METTTKFGIKQYFQPTPKNLRKWLLAGKSLIGTIATADFFNGNPSRAFWIMFAGAALNELANLIGEDITEGN